VRDGRIVEIKSPLILQPGPAALTDGLDAIIAALHELERTCLHHAAGAAPLSVGERSRPTARGEASPTDEPTRANDEA
jgi:hypothetical protein